MSMYDRMANSDQVVREQKRLLALSTTLTLTERERRALGIYSMATAPTVVMPNQNRLDGKQQNEVIKDMGKQWQAGTRNAS